MYTAGYSNTEVHGFFSSDKKKWGSMRGMAAAGGSAPACLDFIQHLARFKGLCPPPPLGRIKYCLPTLHHTRTLTCRISAGQARRGERELVCQLPTDKSTTADLKNIQSLGVVLFSFPFIVHNPRRQVVETFRWFKLNYNSLSGQLKKVIWVWCN